MMEFRLDLNDLSEDISDTMKYKIIDTDQCVSYALS